jgi:hypothetical protein
VSLHPGFARSQAPHGNARRVAPRPVLRVQLPRSPVRSRRLESPFLFVYTLVALRLFLFSIGRYFFRLAIQLLLLFYPIMGYPFLIPKSSRFATLHRSVGKARRICEASLTENLLSSSVAPGAPGRRVPQARARTPERRRPALARPVTSMFLPQRPTSFPGSRTAVAPNSAAVHEINEDSRPVLNGQVG